MTIVAQHVIIGLDPADHASRRCLILAPTHAPGLLNPNWPLCHEAEALQQGWTREQIEDGELACCDQDDEDDADIRHPCTECQNLVHG